MATTTTPTTNNGNVVVTLPCDYCNHHTAVIFCRADSAKLCLFCDQHVHAANALSGKHLRSQICDGCRSAPVTVRCSTDNLVLCRDCDWDAHGNCAVSATHDRTQIDGFTGCPSPLDLASIWGLDILIKNQKRKRPVKDSGRVEMGMWGNPFCDTNTWIQDLMVVPEEEEIEDYVESDNLKKLTLTCNVGKQKNVILKQLNEIYKRSLLLVNDDGGGSGGSDVPRQQEGGDEVEEGGREEEEVERVRHGHEHRHQPFTTLLMMQGPMGVEAVKDGNLEQNLVWEAKRKDHRGTQVMFLEKTCLYMYIWNCGLKVLLMI